MTIVSLNYSSRIRREKEEAEKRARAQRKAAEKAQTEGRVSTRDSGAQTEGSYEESLG